MINIKEVKMAYPRKDKRHFRIILVGGEAEAGKSKFSKILKERIEGQGRKVAIMHFAKYLKSLCSDDDFLPYGIEEGEKSELSREVHQFEGTDYIRARNASFHSEIVAMTIDVYKDRFDYFIIDDWRFPGEFYLLESRFENVKTIKMVRINHNSSLTEDQKMHQSENMLNNFNFNSIVTCHNGVQNIEKAIDEKLFYFMS